MENKQNHGGSVDILKSRRDGGQKVVDEVREGMNRVSPKQTKVKNTVGTREEKAPDGLSWYEYWARESGKERAICSRVGCDEDVDDGAHVYKIEGTDLHTYIVPLCHKCNKGIKEVFVVDEVLIPIPKN